MRGQQSRIVITSEGHIEDEIQRISVSSVFADGNAVLWSINIFQTLSLCVCRYTFIFVCKDPFDPQPT